MNEDARYNTTCDKEIKEWARQDLTPYRIHKRLSAMGRSITQMTIYRKVKRFKATGTL